VRLVHGKGTGALRKAVRGVLSDHPLVASFRDGEPAEGGAGATVAALTRS
jgi:DNA mismatch repair protein MutS2